MAAMEGRVLLGYDRQREFIDYDRPPVAPETCPWLLISHGKNYKIHTFFSVTKNTYYTRSIPWLRNKIPLCNRYGWIVCQDNKTGVCNVFNPISTEDIQLPPLKLVDFIKKVVLSKAPGHPDCLICIIGESEGGRVYLAFCKLGDEKFVESEITLGSNFLFEIFALSGKIYGLMSNYSFVSFDVIDSTLQMNSLVKDDLPFQISTPLPPENSTYQNFFINSSDNDEEVLFVHKIYSASSDEQVTHIRVFRLNLSTMTCEEMESIGESVIFLSDTDGMMYSKPGPGVRINSIYYVEWLDNRLYVHNLEDQSRLLKLPCPNTRKDAIMSWLMI